MPKNMRLRVAVEWEDGEPVILDGEPLAYTQSELIAIVRDIVASMPVPLPFDAKAMSAAVQEEYEHPKLALFSKATTKQTSVEEAVALASKAAHAALGANPEVAKASAASTADAVVSALEKAVYELKKKTLRVFRK